MPFSYLDHPADIKILVEAENLKELFLEALRAMFEIITDTPTSIFKDHKANLREIKVRSFDQETLLADFLSTALAYSEIYQEAYFDCEFKFFDAQYLEGFLYGSLLQKRAIQIKAVTYHDLKIRRVDENKWEAVILFDI